MTYHRALDRIAEEESWGRLSVEEPAESELISCSGIGGYFFSGLREEEISMAGGGDALGLSD